MRKIVLVFSLFMTVSKTQAVNLVLSSPSPVPATNLCAGSVNQIIYSFQIVSDNSNPTATPQLTQLNFATTGSAVNSDLLNFKLWVDSTSTVFSATGLLNTVSASLGAGNHSFSGLTLKFGPSKTFSFWITADIAVAPTNNRTLTVTTPVVGDFIFSTGTLSGTANAAGQQTIKTTPTASAAGTDQANCNNGSFTLAGNNPSTGTGLWSVFSGTATITTPSSPSSGVTGVPVGTCAVLRWTITNGACNSSDDVQLCNDASPTTSAAGTDQSNCNNGSFTLVGNSPSTGTGLWSVFSGTATITTASSPTSGITGVPVGTCAVLRWTISNGSCTASVDNVQLCNDASPTTSAAGTDQSKCNNGSFTLAGNSPSTGTGLWSVFSGTATITTASSPTSGITGVPVGTCAVLRWTISNGSCTPVFDDVQLCNSSSSITVAAGTDQSKCNNGSFTLAGNSPSTGTGLWSVFSGTATITTPSSPSSGVTGVPVGTCAVLRWTITNGACNSSDDVQLCNDASPTTSAAGTDQSNCNNGSFTLAGNSPSTGTGLWSVFSGTATITTASSPTSGITGVPVGTCAVLRWTISNGSCTASVDNVQLCNDASPTTSAAGTDQSKCNNGSFTLAGNSPSTGTGLWSVFSGTATITTPSSPTSGITGVPVGTCAVLRWTITNGACNSSDDVQLCNDASPTTSAAGTDQSKCNNGSFTLAGNSPSTGTGLWSVFSGTATITTASSPTSGITGVPVGTCAVLRWTISNGSCTASVDNVQLCNDASPTTSAAGTDQSKCNSGSFTLAGNNPSTGTGLWSVFSGTATITTPSSPSSGVTGVPVGTCAVLRWTISNGSCTASVDNVQLCNDASPTTSAAGTDQSKCNNGSFTLAGNSPSTGTGLWSVFSGTATITTPSSPTSGITGVPVGTCAVLRWTISNGSCPSSVDNVQLCNNTLPNPVIVGDSVLCEGENTLLTVVDFSGHILTNFNWSTSQTTNPITTIVLPVGSTNFTVSVTDNNSCTKTVSEIVLVTPTPDVPVVSPQIIADLADVCSGSKNISIVVDVTPGVSQYSYSSTDLVFPDPPINLPNIVFSVSPSNINFNTSIIVTQTNQFNCSSSLNIPVNISANSAPTDEDIILKQPGNLLIYADNSMDRYQWGFDSVSNNFPSFIDGQIYQVFVPESRFITTANTLDTVNFNYWVLVTKGECQSKIYYNGPFAQNRIDDPSPVPDEITSTIIPNPNNGNFDFNLSGKIYGQVDLRIFNSIGQLVSFTQHEKTLPSESFSIRLPSLNQGLYFIKVSDVYGERLVSKLLIR